MLFTFDRIFDLQSPTPRNFMVVFDDGDDHDAQQPPSQNDIHYLSREPLHS